MIKCNFSKACQLFLITAFSFFNASLLAMENASLQQPDVAFMEEMGAMFDRLAAQDETPTKQHDKPFMLFSILTSLYTTRNELNGHAKTAALDIVKTCMINTSTDNASRKIDKINAKDALSNLDNALQRLDPKTLKHLDPSQIYPDTDAYIRLTLLTTEDNSKGCIEVGLVFSKSSCQSFATGLSDAGFLSLQKAINESKDTTSKNTSHENK